MCPMAPPSALALRRPVTWSRILARGPCCAQAEEVESISSRAQGTPAPCSGIPSEIPARGKRPAQGPRAQCCELEELDSRPPSLWLWGTIKLWGVLTSVAGDASGLPRGHSGDPERSMGKSGALSGADAQVSSRMAWGGAYLAESVRLPGSVALPIMSDPYHNPTRRFTRGC